MVKERNTRSRSPLSMGALFHAALATVSLLALAGCGGSGGSWHVVSVVVETQNGEPVDSAVVADPGLRLRAVSDRAGDAQLRGLGAAVYRLTIAAHGYYSTETRVHGTEKRLVVRLAYRPATGIYVFFDSGRIGQTNGYDWAQAVITSDSASATEFDWSCNPSPRTGKLVGAWQSFPVELPMAIGPDAIAPGWVRRTVAVTHPPPPPYGCSAPLSPRHGRTAHFALP
jgi:hypothetical protein